MSRPGRSASLAAGSLAAIVGLAGPAVQAGEDDRALSWSGGATVVGQAADDDRVGSELTASADLFVDVPVGAGVLHVYVEASTLPNDGGVSELLPEANADAGTAVIGGGDLRAQVSELKYAIPLPDGHELTVGLIDPTVYLDTTRIDNDENMQFLGSSFLNDPTIEFPDYTLGLVYGQAPEGRRPAIVVALTGSDGLADDPDPSYAEVVDLTAEGKGVFLGAEALWSRHGHYRLGAWVHTADHVSLDGVGAGGDNYGAYLAVGRTVGRHSANLRLGAAAEDVSEASRFASLTYQLVWGSRRLVGLGAARTRLSGAARGPGRDDFTQLEAYLRLDLGRGLFVTPSVQVLNNSRFDATDVTRRDRVVVWGLRLHSRF